MAKTKLDNFYRGDTKTYRLTFNSKLGDSTNIVGWVFFITFKSDPDALDADAELQKSFIIPNDADAQNGIGVLQLESDETIALEPGTYFYDFQRVINTTVPATVSTIISGKIKVLKDISQNVT